MEEKVSEILENILGLLGMEGSFEVSEKEEGVFVEIETEDPGKLIGRGGETLSALQLLINLAITRKNSDGEAKRVIVDVAGWKSSKEDDLIQRVAAWVQSVVESKEPLELEPMPAWQRRVVHLEIEKHKDVKSESVGEGENRHLVITPV